MTYSKNNNIPILEYYIHNEVESFYDFILNLNCEWIILTCDLNGNYEYNSQKVLLILNGQLLDEKIFINKNSFYPLIIRKTYLCEMISAKYKLINLQAFVYSIYKNHAEQIVFIDWNKKVSIRPNAIERYQRKVLYKWWSTYEKNTINFNTEKTLTIAQQNLNIKEFIDSSNNSYDVFIIKNVNTEFQKRIINDLKDIALIYCINKNDLYCAINLNDENREVANERSISQTVDLTKVRTYLSKSGFIIRLMKTLSNVSSLYIYEHYSNIIVNKCNNQSIDLMIINDLPGIGDSVRNCGLIVPISEKYKSLQIKMINNIKAYYVFKNHPLIKEQFVCSIRPDPPGFPYVVSGLLSDYLSINRPKKFISWAWNMSSYFENVKKNFIDVYAGISHVNWYSNPKVYSNKKDMEKTLDILDDLNFNHNKVTVGIQFKASMESKSWRNEHILKLIDMLKGVNKDIQIINLDYRDINHQLVINCGKHLNINEYICAFSFCDFFIGVDSSGGHIAAAYGIASVIIFGKEKPRIGNDHIPLSDNNICLIPSKDCECPEYDITCPFETKCIDTVSPETVLYSLWKAETLNYNKNKKKIGVKYSPTLVWKLVKKFVVLVLLIKYVF